MTVNHLATHLDELSAALDDGEDLGAILAVLMDDITTAVPSFIGVRLAVRSPDGDPVVLTGTLLPGAPVRASLRLPLDRLVVAPPGATITYYAAQPDAFLDLAATARQDYGLGGHVELDEHLHPPAVPELTGFDGPATTNQAIGVLIDQGHTPCQASRLIAAHAVRTGRTPARAAMDLIELHLPVDRD